MSGYFDPIELVTPYTLFWQVTSLFTLSTIKVEMDLRLPSATSDDIKLILERIWNNVWAPLQPRPNRCFAYGATPILVGPPALIFGSLDLKGAVIATPTSINESLVITAWGGNEKSSSQRRFYIPFVPSGFVSNGVFTDGAIRIINTRLRGLVLGCDGRRGGVGPALIIFHPPVADSKRGPAVPARFEDVDQIIINSYSDRAPVG